MAAAAGDIAAPSVQTLQEAARGGGLYSSGRAPARSEVPGGVPGRRQENTAAGRQAIVKKLRATDATAENPMQAADAAATPTDVLLGFVI